MNYRGGGNFSGNRNVNVNNVNGYRGGNYGGGYGGWGGGWDHPVAAAATVGAAAAVTSAAIGSAYNTLPSGCGAYVNGYYQCGSTYYQPQYSGTDVQYTVVNAPQ